MHSCVHRAPPWARTVLGLMHVHESVDFLSHSFVELKLRGIMRLQSAVDSVLLSHQSPTGVVPSFPQFSRSHRHHSRWSSCPCRHWYSSQNLQPSRFTWQSRGWGAWWLWSTWKKCKADDHNENPEALEAWSEWSLLWESWLWEDGPLMIMCCLPWARYTNRVWMILIVVDTPEFIACKPSTFTEPPMAQNPKLPSCMKCNQYLHALLVFEAHGAQKIRAPAFVVHLLKGTFFENQVGDLIYREAKHCFFARHSRCWA